MIAYGPDTRYRMLQVIDGFRRQHGYAPTLRYIGDQVGIESTSTIHRQIGMLEDGGLLEHDEYKARSYRLTDEGRELLDVYLPCVVPGCEVRSKSVTPAGMCPEWLWSEDHFEYARSL